MNTNNIKRYAPKARTAFIAAMTKRAALFGIRESSIPSMGIEPLEQKGDLALIGDRPFPASIIRPRAALVKKVEQMGFAQAMEQAAYSWFNRLCAIRFMELKGYLDHGRRVLSHPEQPGSFQILDDCLDIELEGLDPQRIAELKLDGTKDEELYRELLLAQCHALHQAMPFLFEAVDDATELLLPDNLTKTDSLIRELVSAIPEEDWHDVEIIGWLYQFYISEKKDQVIGKVVKSEDIPAATQLFTPNWIVQYMVQNSLGRQWLQTYPDSPLKAKMSYYIEPAEQTPEVQAQLTAMTPESIDPLSIKVLDPACGSGHILVEAYRVLKEIYTERGQRSRDIPQLILEHNLFGLDIDDRAGQLAGFTLMMLAREDDRRIFDREVKLNVLSLQESSQLDFPNLWKALNLNSDWQRGQSRTLFDSQQSDLSAAQADNRYLLLKATLARFTQAKTFGSLIEVPTEDAKPLGELLEQLRHLAKDGDVMQKPAAHQIIPYVQQAWVLAQRFDAVVANPPYMGSKYQTPTVKKFLKDNFGGFEKDLFSAFIIRNIDLAKPHGQLGFMTPFVWMFISSYETLRARLIDEEVISTLVQLEYSGFDGATVPICTFTLNKGYIQDYKGSYIRLSEFRGAINQGPKTLEAIRNRDCGWFYMAKPDDFKKIPSSPIAYWESPSVLETFVLGESLGKKVIMRKGMVTADNESYIRNWSEVSFSRVGLELPTREASKASGKKWFPYTKGGEFKKWYGNNQFVVNWENDGYLLQNKRHHTDDRVAATNFNLDFIFKPGATYSSISSSSFSIRYTPPGFLYDQKGAPVFSESKENLLFSVALLNSKVASRYLKILCPTLDFNSGSVVSIPVLNQDRVWGELREKVNHLIDLSKLDWDSFEFSWDFKLNPIVKVARHDGQKKIRTSIAEHASDWRDKVLDAANVEASINSELAKAYNSLCIEDSTACTDEVTLLNNPKYRYGVSEEDHDKAPIQMSDITSELVFYGIGCIMGRYSLDREGLVYAHAGNQGFAELVAEGAYKTFPADSDGILPLTDQEWFADDATNCFREFVRTVWGDEHLQENLDFVAESLCLHAIKHKRGESALDTIRRYLSTQFFKDHLKTYKKRPIYWLFSSGKHKAFECLVYLHRYNEGTLARMRTEYVIPLTAKLNTYANKLEQDIEASTSTAEKKALEKQLATLHNQQAELATFDEKLRHHADQRISLDLDDGVKVNYGKFGDLLAEVKAVTGDKGD
ncbi:BREX-1 system adenine-specific DNA-methyltransferase PglX [Pseudomonas lactis]|uniref:site-specific DNA-methyltransferase (adenine-specific) n=1 Tax=Pseudomonas lactis TaxID=1615674 RepID=A0A7Y1M7R7_9PSED|nr:MULTISPECIES: BREX-1 system adenine-specific DNA-methyltransferase PglX [Pseudomonas]KRP75783.1 Type II restriction enzyme [Pseudomonas lactis]NNA76617.1 BREX-1 system adenine-specific DNA-methyltransferase PglX [Pseudomonas lactis]NNA82426.1 BREX-1 system adenine-specific DNA-methyltransferase PglX [Pseudomonas lactis]